MKSFTVLGKIGKGAYGDIFMVSDEKGDKKALKMIKNDENGISCILEVIIMSSIQHPYINKAEFTFLTSYVNIVQELAISDLAEEIRQRVPEITVAKRWFAKIILAVSFLHKINIIHADIKPANVLYYGLNESGPEVKLTDFTLSVKKRPGCEVFLQPACTYNYAPPECLLGCHWDESLDLWSLGCLFYELVFGKILFDDQNPSDKIKYHDAIAEFTGNKLIGSGDHKSCQKDDRFNSVEYIQVRDVIDGLLKYNPKERVALNDLVKMDFFRGIKSHFELEVYQKICPSVEEVNISFSDKLDRILVNFSDNEAKNIKKIALGLYKKVDELIIKKKSDTIGIIGIACIWIAIKLIAGVKVEIDLNYKLEDILEAEKEICLYTSFCLLDL